MHIKKQLKCIVAIWDSDLGLGLGTRTWDSELEARDFETGTQETGAQETGAQEPELLTQDF